MTMKGWLRLAMATKIAFSCATTKPPAGRTMPAAEVG